MKALGMMVVIFGSLVRNECKENKDKMFFFFFKKQNSMQGWQYGKGIIYLSPILLDNDMIKIY